MEEFDLLSENNYHLYKIGLVLVFFFFNWHEQH